MITITKAFKFAHDGVRIEEFETGQVVEQPSEELRAVAVREGWARQGSLENKDAAQLVKGRK